MRLRVLGSFAVAAVAVALLFAVNADRVLAALVAGQDIIPAPASVADDAPGATNTAQQAFDEAQGVVLTAPLAVDGGAIPAGTVVDSHMIFLNTPAGGPGASDAGVVWEFDGAVIGVMSDSGGLLEAASNALLGAAATFYPGAFGARGMEGADDYTVAGNTITVDMFVAEPGDWIRVVTRTAAVGGCPPGWDLEDSGALDPKDNNADGYVCHKDIPGKGKGNTGEGHNHKDNNQPLS